ncbi:MAG: hypothetical protein FWB83_01060 [Treponema sp.]|nr:hypothetical protein [Treponema sp.]
MKKVSGFFLSVIILFLAGCEREPEIVRRQFQYEKIFFGTYKIEVDIYLENIGESGKTAELIRRLIYRNKNFDEYAAHAESVFTGDIKSEDYPPQIDDDGIEYFYRSNLTESYNIMYHDKSFVVIEYNNYFYYTGTAHGGFRTQFYIIDIAGKRILDIEDMISPIRDDYLKEIILREYDINNFLRDEIWPPDTINISQEGIDLIWNIYTITPYSSGVIFINIPDEASNQYLKNIGRKLKEARREEYLRASKTRSVFTDQS